MRIFLNIKILKFNAYFQNYCALSNNSKTIYFTYVFPTHPEIKPSALKYPFFGIGGALTSLKLP